MVGDPDELLTVSQVIAELQVPRSTFYRWRKDGDGPPWVQLPNGAVRIRRAALTGWLRGLEHDDRKEHTG